jgi:hypothetical protein
VLITALTIIAFWTLLLILTLSWDRSGRRQAGRRRAGPDDFREEVTYLLDLLLDLVDPSLDRRALRLEFGTEDVDLGLDRGTGRQRSGVSSGPSRPEHRTPASLLAELLAPRACAQNDTAKGPFGAHIAGVLCA